MTLVITTWIECDAKDCVEVEQVGLGETAVEARERLGWVRRKQQDLCPKHQ